MDLNQEETPLPDIHTVPKYDLGDTRFQEGKRTTLMKGVSSRVSFQNIKEIDKVFIHSYMGCNTKQLLSIELRNIPTTQTINKLDSNILSNIQTKSVQLNKT